MSSTLEPDSILSGTDAQAKVTTDAPVALKFYRVVWRWHFYAGLFAIPFVLVLAITGIVMLFKPQLNAVMYRQQMFVTPKSSALPYTEQLAAALAVYPEAAAWSFRPADQPDRSAEVGLTTADERNLTVFVDPYTGNVLGERNDDSNLQILAEKIHGDLLIGDFGDRLLELAACWGIVLAISGLYLWWPRKGSRIWGTLLPRLTTTNRRVFWRDLHAVPGFWGAILIVFFMLTGLPWTGFWGDSFAKAWSGFPPQLWDDVPISTQLTGSLNDGGSKVVPWAVEQMPLPESDADAHAAHQPAAATAATPLVTGEGIAPGVPVNLDSVIALAYAKDATDGFLVNLPGDESGVYTVSPPFPTNALDEVTLHIDQYSGKILADVRWADYALVPKMVEGGVSLHMGGMFGLANQLLMLFGCLVLILLSISGTVMWWQRRPAGKLGAPPMPKNMPLWRGAVVIILVLALVFPLMGASLLVVLLLDFLVISRVPPLKRAIG